MEYRAKFPGAPNVVLDGDGFYISYNEQDVEPYGSDTTAIIVGHGDKFYILKGDHRKQYKALLKHGLTYCLHYFAEHSDLAHKYSDKLP